MFLARPFSSSSINEIFEYYDRIHRHFLHSKDWRTDDENY